MALTMCPTGPRPARELLEELGFVVVLVDDLPEESPTLQAGTVLLALNNERVERSLLEAASAIVLERAGRVVDHADVLAVASELSRPRAVRSAR